MTSVFNILKNVFGGKKTVLPDVLSSVKDLSDKELHLLKTVGITYQQLLQNVNDTTNINYERSSIYRELERAQSHWMMGAATDLFADYSTPFNQLQGRSIWPVSKDTLYTKTLEKLFDELELEEKLYDWAWSIGGFGDLFVDINGHPGLGIVSITDNIHPSAISRVDYDGALIGFYPNSFDAGGMQAGPSESEATLSAPWKYVHFRLLGAVKRRPAYCLAGNTKISLLNGTTPTIQEMFENKDKYIKSHVWSIDPVTGRMEYDEIEDIQKTRLNADLIRVELDNDEHIDCTPDHRFMMRDGSYKEAKDLKCDDSLMPFYRIITVRNNRKTVDRIIWLSKKEDTYDITTKKNHNFPVTAGVFVHNSDPSWQEHRTIYLMGTETKQVSTKYGTSLLFNGLPVYKRLRMAEDALLLARLTRGIQKYIYRVKVDSSNPEAAGQLITEYMNILKHARALNTTEGVANFENSSNQMSVIEDLFVPVFGDVGDVSIDKIGGEPDIKWIVDIEELRNQLSCSLRVPVSLLGGYVQEASGQMGSEILGKLDVRFARSSRRLQRAIITGVRRLCQIHLAYLGMDPDPRLFDIQMGETSTAEEEQIKDALDTSTDVVSKFMDMVGELEVPVDKVAILNYFNKKLLKLNDFDIDKFIKKEPVVQTTSVEQPQEEEESEVVISDNIAKEFYSFLPISDKITSRLSNLNETVWNEQYKPLKVKTKIIKS